MGKKRQREFDYQLVELDGIRYVILREATFFQLCQRAGVEQSAGVADAEKAASTLDLDRSSLAAKLIRRRRAVGLTQAELARRAAIRPETLNRIERGRTTPDFATVRKLVIAMNEAEIEAADL
jgi:DNA-binding XRE family transcriptional regulator